MRRLTTWEAAHPGLAALQRHCRVSDPADEVRPARRPATSLVPCANRTCRRLAVVGPLQSKAVQVGNRVYCDTDCAAWGVEEVER